MKLLSRCGYCFKSTWIRGLKMQPIKIKEGVVEILDQEFCDNKCYNNWNKKEKK